MPVSAVKKVQYETTEVDPIMLSLDLENPRFGLKHIGAPDEAFSVLVETANLRELWDSISSQGWIDFEPLVCLDIGGGRYTVIEGNRRVAALQTLLNPSLLPVRYQNRVPIIDNDVRSSIKTIKIVVVQNRHDADAFIGFKHVNGPASWGSLPKAKFATDMFARIFSISGNADSALEETTKALGDTNAAMLRMLVGYKILQQALDLGFVLQEDLEKNSFDFSHLYTMMPNPATREFLGLGADPLRAENVVDEPISPDRYEQLTLLVGWLFGGDTVKKVIASQGTDRPKLQKVLAHSAATETLIATNDLESAAAKAGLDVKAWRDRLIKSETDAKNLLKDLSEVQSRIEPDATIDSIERAGVTKATFNAIQASLKSFDED